MSKLSRYNLLISLIRSELRYEHVFVSNLERKQNVLLYKRSMEAWIFLSDDLMYECNCSIQSRDKRISNLIFVLNNYDTSLVLNTLKTGYDILIDHISGKVVLGNYVDFKGRFPNDMGALIGFLFGPIKESLNNVLHSQTVVCRGCFKTLAKRDMWMCSQYLLFNSKINFGSVGLEEKALEDYLEFEHETSQFTLDDIQPYIRPLQSILYEWLKDWSYDGNNSKHGPGSVADSQRGKIHKYSSFAVDSKIRYLYGNDNSAVSSILPFRKTQKALRRTSELVFVPKNITKLRSISMEPTTLQYLQQGCMDSLYNYFDHHPHLSKILQLKDQSQNKSFAYEGSITNSYATLDLSHASDSVNWNLVLTLFRRVPQLIKWLVCTRSTHTLLPNGDEIPLGKFAPMGSALCFPIESLIFAAIAVLSQRLAKEEALDRDNCTGIRSCYDFVSVYGDDIILPTYAASICSKLLRYSGFTLNESKSYLTGPFKESCGGNYFCGYDITAVKFAPSFDIAYKRGVSPDAYAALCDYANIAYAQGTYLFRLYCIKLIFEAGLKPLFTDNLNSSPAIYSPTPTNFHLKVRYVKRYQKYQYLYTGVKTVEKDVTDVLKENNGHIFLYDCLLNGSREPSEFKFDSSSLLTFKEQHRRYRIMLHKDIVELYQQNAIIRKGIVNFDTRSAYQTSTLMPQILKYTLCSSDIDLSTVL